MRTIPIQESVSRLKKHHGKEELGEGKETSFQDLDQRHEFEMQEDELTYQKLGFCKGKRDEEIGEERRRTETTPPTSAMEKGMRSSFNCWAGSGFFTVP